MNRFKSFPWEDNPFASSSRVIVRSVNALGLHVDGTDSELFDGFSAQVICYNSEAVAGVRDVVDDEDPFSYDLHCNRLGYPWLFVSNSDVLVEFNFHIREVRVLQKVAHDSGWGPASSRDPHDNFWLVPVLLDLSC